MPKAGADLIVVGSLEEARERAEAYTDRSEWAAMILSQNEIDEALALTDVSKERAKLDKLQGISLSQRLAKMKVETDEGYTCNLIVATNSDGSMSAIETCIDVVSKEMGVKFPVLRSIIGDLSVGDIEEAVQTEAMVLTFNAKLPRPIQNAAQTAGVDLLKYNLIYELEDKLREAAIELLPIIYEEQSDGKAEAMEIFHLNGRNMGSVIGLRVKQGKLETSSIFRLIRGGEIVADNLKVRSLRVLKDDVQVVKSGADCGLLLVNSAGHGVVGEIGDEIEGYTQVVVEREFKKSR